jgi:energy-coupling factor transporter ATP-binding protein EcfA2
MSIQEQIQLAIENGWMLRPVKGHRFINKEHKKDIPLDSTEMILEDVDDLKDFPPGVSAVALASPLHEGFVCLDLDFKDDALKKQIWSLLSSYKKEELFLRIGHREKFGQLWFRTFDNIGYCSYKGIDVITTQKRCDAIGSYKGEDQLYEWPYKNIWENQFDDLPIINEDLVDKIVDAVCKYNGVDKNQNNKQGRHDQLMQIAKNSVRANKRINDILDDLFSSEAYKELMKERNANAEIGNILSWVMKNEAKSFIKFTDGSVINDAFAGYSIPKRPPRVEKHSLFDMLYRAIRRNQVIDNKRMAMITTLAICSWICTTGVRFRGIAPNLMMLLIAPSGSGKSTSTKAIKEIIKVEKRLKKSFGGQDIRTDAAIFSAVQNSPVNFYFIDEATKLLKSAKNKNSHNSNVGEILSQLYSDFQDTDPPMALAKLKNESYGVAIGAKVVTLMSSTESFWNVFDEENYTQGFGRRLFIVTSSDIPLHSKRKKNYEEYFHQNEVMALRMFFNAYFGKNDLYEEVDISEYGIIRETENKNGVRTNHIHKTCKKPRIILDLTADAETQEYLDNKFIDEANDFKIKAASSGSNIQQYVANSRAEFILKLAIIYAVCGKKMMPDSYNALQINTMINMKCIEWATLMFDYYMTGSTLEMMDSLFKKDDEIDKSKAVIHDFIMKLEEKNISEFKKSDQFIRNFFKKIGGASYRDKILNEMKALDLIELDGELDSRNCNIKVR